MNIWPICVVTHPIRAIGIRPPRAGAAAYFTFSGEMRCASHQADLKAAAGQTRRARTAEVKSASVPTCRNQENM